MSWIYWLGRLLSASILKCFFDVEVVNAEKRIEDGGAIIAVNHASFLDPPLVGISYANPLHFLARSTLFEGLGASILPKCNAVPVDRDNADLKSMKTILRTLKQGHRVVMFPEGTRSEDGELQEGKAGVGMLIAKSKVRVQPVRILNSHKALPRKGGIGWGQAMKVVIGDPMVLTPEELKGKSREAYQAISDRVMGEIAKLG